MLCCVFLCCVTLRCIVLRCLALYCVVSCRVVLCYVVSCRVVSYHNALRYTVLCRVVLRYAVLRYSRRVGAGPAPVLHPRVTTLGAHAELGGPRAPAAVDYRRSIVHTLAFDTPLKTRKTHNQLLLQILPPRLTTKMQGLHEEFHVFRPIPYIFTKA